MRQLTKNPAPMGMDGNPSSVSSLRTARATGAGALNVGVGLSLADFRKHRAAGCALGGMWRRWEWSGMPYSFIHSEMICCSRSCDRFPFQAGASKFSFLVSVLRAGAASAFFCLLDQPHAHVDLRGNRGIAAVWSREPSSTGLSRAIHGTARSGCEASRRSCAL